MPNGWFTVTGDSREGLDLTKQCGVNNRDKYQMRLLYYIQKMKNHFIMTIEVISIVAIIRGRARKK